MKKSINVLVLLLFTFAGISCGGGGNNGSGGNEDAHKGTHKIKSLSVLNATSSSNNEYVLQASEGQNEVEVSLVLKLKAQPKGQVGCVITGKNNKVLKDETLATSDFKNGETTLSNIGSFKVETTTKIKLTVKSKEKGSNDTGSSKQISIKVLKFGATQEPEKNWTEQAQTLNSEIESALNSSTTTKERFQELNTKASTLMSKPDFNESTEPGKTLKALSVSLTSKISSMDTQPENPLEQKQNALKKINEWKGFIENKNPENQPIDTLNSWKSDITIALQAYDSDKTYGEVDTNTPNIRDQLNSLLTKISTELNKGLEKETDKTELQNTINNTKSTIQAALYKEQLDEPGKVLQALKKNPNIKTHNLDLTALENEYNQKKNKLKPLETLKNEMTALKSDVDQLDNLDLQTIKDETGINTQKDKVKDLETKYKNYEFLDANKTYKNKLQAISNKIELRRKAIETEQNSTQNWKKEKNTLTDLTQKVNNQTKLTDNDIKPYIGKDGLHTKLLTLGDSLANYTTQPDYTQKKQAYDKLLQDCEDKMCQIWKIDLDKAKVEVNKYDGKTTYATYSAKEQWFKILEADFIKVKVAKDASFNHNKNIVKDLNNLFKVKSKVVQKKRTPENELIDIAKLVDDFVRPITTEEKISKFSVPKLIHISSTLKPDNVGDGLIRLFNTKNRGLIKGKLTENTIKAGNLLLAKLDANAEKGGLWFKNGKCTIGKFEYAKGSQKKYMEEAEKKKSPIYKAFIDFTEKWNKHHKLLGGKEIDPKTLTDVNSAKALIIDTTSKKLPIPKGCLKPHTNDIKEIKEAKEEVTTALTTLDKALMNKKFKPKKNKWVKRVYPKKSPLSARLKAAVEEDPTGKLKKSHPSRLWTKDFKLVMGTGEFKTLLSVRNKFSLSVGPEFRVTTLIPTAPGYLNFVLNKTMNMEIQLYPDEQTKNKPSILGNDPTKKLELLIVEPTNLTEFNATTLGTQFGTTFAKLPGNKVLKPVGINIEHLQKDKTYRFIFKLTLKGVVAYAWHNFKYEPTTGLVTLV